VTLLIDTHALLWFQAGDRRLSRAARTAMEDSGAQLVISAASIWEMAIKASLGRLTLPSSVDAYVAEKVSQGFRTLGVSAMHAAAVERLPWHHRDPFDRVLVAQALVERHPVVTRDRMFRRYGATVVW
jgi:PIN domain nuclease of toxin-antitoxin system